MPQTITQGRPDNMPFDGSVYGNGTTTATSGANTITHFYDRMGIKAATDENIFAQVASRRNMPMKYGKTYKVSTWLHILDDANVNNQGLDKDGKVIADGNAYGSTRDIGSVTTGMPTLAEGAGRVNRVGVVKKTIETSLKRLGNFIEYNDEVDKFSEDSVQVHYREELGYMAGQVQDDLVQIDMINAAGIVAYTGSHTKISEIVAGEYPTYNLIRTTCKQLFVNKAKKNKTIVSGSVKIDTRTINSAWLAFISSDMKYVLEGVKDNDGKTAWIPAYKYAAAGTLAKGEVGAIHDTRFIEAPRMMGYDKGAVIVGDGTTKVATSPILYVTEDSFATVGLQGNKKIVFKSKAPGVATEFDPYGLKGLFSYSFFYASIAIRPERIAVIWSATE